MKERRPFCRRPGCLIAFSLLVAAVIAVWMVHSTVQPYYTHEVLVKLPSPTGAWTAVVSEDTVEGISTTGISAAVELISSEHPAQSTELLGVDTSGHHQDRPRIAWSAPNVLRVTVPNLSYLKVLTRHADGVDVDLHF